jgi:RNA polymerase sigma factor (sigma-70 family)
MEVSALNHPSSITGLRGPSALLRLQSDERLIALTRRGQHAAFEVLCSRYQSRLLSFCRHMLGSREDAEDVLQEVFAAAFNAVLADERDINVRPWLYRIARNRSLNHLRRASAVGVDSMDIHLSENGLSTSDKVLRRESFRELIADVHELPETQRSALLLREIDALSYEQIAHAMETTVPSVKSLLVRARISLAEAAEARKLSCEEVRLELGEVAEGLAKLSTPARRHVRGCERCLAFKKHLKQNNHALAAILPVAPLLILKKLVLAKLGTTASAGGAHVAGGAGATAGAAATIGAGAAATGGGAGFAGGLVTAGAGALATKAVAGLAAAAIVTAGVAAADHSAGARHHHSHTAGTAYASTVAHPSAPTVVHELSQPLSAGITHRNNAAALARRRARHARALKAVKPVAPSDTPVSTATAPVTQPAATAKPEGQPAVQVTEVTTETTQLPTAATGTPTTTAPEATPPPVTTTTPTPPPVTPPAQLPSAEPVPVPNPTPPSGEPKPGEQGGAGNPGGTAAPSGAPDTADGPSSGD